MGQGALRPFIRDIEDLRHRQQLLYRILVGTVVVAWLAGVGAIQGKPSTVVLFVVAEKDQKLLDEPFVPQPYKSWYSHISSKGAPYRAAVDLENKEGRIEELQKYLDDLHTQIKGEVLRVTTQVPF